MAQAVADEVGDGDHEDAVLLGHLHEVGHAGHGAVVVHDLADDSARRQAGEAGQVDRRLGLAGPLEHAAGAALEREDMPGLHEVVRAALGVDRDLDRVRAVVRRDAGGDPFARLDGHREGGLERRFVLGRHQVEAQFVTALGRQ